MPPLPYPLRQPAPRAQSNGTLEVNDTSAASQDEPFLAIAFAEAKQAATEGNAPIGALLVSADGQVLARAHNRATTHDGLLYHAEMLLFLHNQALLLHERWTLTLYSTLEPCLMCLSTALVHHIKRIVWLVDDNWAGGTRCLNQRATYIHNNQSELVHQPIPRLKEEMIPLLVDFYAKKWPLERVALILGQQLNS